MTPSLLRDFIRAIGQPGDPTFEVYWDSWEATVTVHFFGLAPDRTRLALQEFVRGVIPRYLAFRFTDETCIAHSDCRKTPELARACWLETNAKAVET
jgi:hypothetical protein